MRVLYFLVLAVIVAAITIFAVQNYEDITLRYLDRELTVALPLLVAAIYFLGMLSGWTVVGFLRRSVQRLTDDRAR